MLVTVLEWLVDGTLTDKAADDCVDEIICQVREQWILFHV